MHARNVKELEHYLFQLSRYLFQLSCRVTLMRYRWYISTWLSKYIYIYIASKYVQAITVNVMYICVCVCVCGGGGGACVHACLCACLCMHAVNMTVPCCECPDMSLLRITPWRDLDLTCRLTCRHNIQSPVSDGFTQEQNHGQSIQ